MSASAVKIEAGTPALTRSEVEVKSPTSRIPGLDTMRSAAIGIVMVSHAGLGAIVPGGFGVTVFFFLSGYLITTLLRLEVRNSGRVDLLAFYARRCARILPPMWATVALTVFLIAVGAMGSEIAGSGIVTDLLFLTNYAPLLGAGPGAPIPLWSLDVEEHFYLLFPGLFAVLASLGSRRTAGVLLAICAAVLVVRIATFVSIGEAQIYYWSHTRIDSIVWGAILAVWMNPVADDAPVFRPTPVQLGMAFAVIVLTFIYRTPAFRETIRYTLQGAALLVIFSAVIQARGPVARLLNNRVTSWIAALSYTLYLIHMPMLKMFNGWPPLAAVPLAYAFAVGWAWLIYRLVERPIARWRHRSLARRLRATTGNEAPLHRPSRPRT